jgi:hypothetical protein
MRHLLTFPRLTGYKVAFEIPFSKKAVDDILKKHTTNKKILLAVAFARTKGKLHSQPIFKIGDKSYVINNIDDLKNGSFDDLRQLGERALSTDKPSLHRLKSPVLSDPATSLWRKSLPVQQAILQQTAAEE